MGYVFWLGTSTAKTKAEAQQLQAIVESVERYEEIKHEVIQLSPADLRKRYCEWVRDSKALCMQANIPLTSGQDN